MPKTSQSKCKGYVFVESRSGVEGCRSLMVRCRVIAICNYIQIQGRDIWRKRQGVRFWVKGVPRCYTVVSLEHFGNAQFLR